MAERLRIKAKLAEAPAEDGVDARPRPSILAEALHAARSGQPSRDRAKNGPEKAALLVALGLVPAHLAALAALWLPSVERLWLEGGHRALAVRAVYAIAVLALPLASAWAGTFVLSLAFLFATRLSGSRVRQALVCPYCRDEVEQEGTVCCVRKGCGAFYHRECWDECAVQYGGCAIYGCSSKKSREVSAAGYVLQIGRLLVAAALFPPRIARAIRDVDEGEGLVQIWKRARKATSFVVADEGGNEPVANYKLGLYVVYTLSSYALVLLTLSRLMRNFSFWARTSTWASPILGLLFITMPIALPWALALPTTLAFFTLRAVALAFKNELAALTRADEGGGSVIGRLRSGFGGKKDCH
jgi:hypothetical protein